VFAFMRCLFLDLASHGSAGLTTSSGLLALVTEKEVLSSKDVDRKIPDHRLLALFEELLKETDMLHTNLTHLACIVGPGGFTSLRVASAFINTLAFANGIPSCGMHLSDLYAARLQGGSEDVLWLHSTKKHELFVRGFGMHKKKWPAPLHISLQECLESLPEGALWMGELLPEHRTAMEEHGLGEAPLMSVRDVLPVFLPSQEYDKSQIIPWYGRSG
jgi:tRNA A37 threonylcarbamoyladenosine modification protein TsaB